VRGSPKSEHNPCPVCGLPRGKCPHEYAHGKCYEALAKKEGVETVEVVFNGKVKVLKKSSIIKARHASASKRYLAGKLPKWMTDK